VELDKTLYDCVEAAKLRHDHLTKQLREFGFVGNAYDPCVFNKTEDGVTLTIVLHVDDLLIACKSQQVIDAFVNYFNGIYKGDMTRHQGVKLNYVGMSMDFSMPGQVSIAMANMIKDLL
jgi:hypothetical protein